MSDIIIEEYNSYGVIILNRKDAMGALSLDMLRVISNKLDIWKKDKTIKAVLIKSNLNKAFCSGGDVKEVAKRAKLAQLKNGSSKFVTEFFKTEYLLNAKIASFPKPYIAFLNAIVMGGGAGVSLHGSHIIADCTVKFAMPESKIGFFTDVGSGFFLTKSVGYTGLYLALTGNVISGEDMAKLGFASHFTKDSNLKDILEDVLNSNNPDDILTKYSYKKSKYKYQDKIDKYFSKPSLELIFKALEQDSKKDIWCFDTYTTLSKACPTSLKVIFRHFYLSKKLNDIKKITDMDFCVAQNLSKRADFYEGVRAVLIDKTNDAKWSPATIWDIKDSDIDAIFN